MFRSVLRRHARLTVLSLVACVSLAAAAPAPGAGRAKVKELFYGRTNFGGAVSLELVGGRTSGTAKPSFQDRSYIMDRHDTELPVPGRVRIGSRKTTWHRRVHDGPLSAEIWFTTRRSGGKIAGSYHKKLTVQSGRTYDEGTTRFTARLWASSGGASWTGRAEDGSPLNVTVVDLPAPEAQPRYLLRVPSLPAALTCGGAATSATISDLSAPLVAAGGIRIAPVGGAYMFRDGLRTAAASPARGSVRTAEGATVNAELAIDRLAWKGKRLQAAGSLSFSGTGAGGSSCQAAQKSFVLYPR